MVDTVARGLTKEKIADFCRDRLSEYYRAGVPDFARKRLERELACAGADAAAEYLLLYHALSQTAERSGHILHTAGEMTGSLPVFLLGQSRVNPLPAHAYCPACGWFEVSDSLKCGLDMGPRRCPSCGSPVRQEGFSLAPEMVWSARNRAEGPSRQFRCSEGFLPYAMETIRGFCRPRGKEALPLGAVNDDDTRKLRHIGAAVLPPGKSFQDFPQFSAYLLDGTPCLCGEFWQLIDAGIERIVISENILPTALQKAQAASGVFAADMLDALQGVTARDLANTAMVTERECIALQGSDLSYYDMVCRLTFPHNSYTEDCFALLSLPEWEACPLYSRDDAFDELVSRGFSAENAAKAAAFIRQGQAARHPERMEEMGLPRCVRDTAARCLYLFPRASGAQWLVSLMLLAGYMRRDPAAYFQALPDMPASPNG